MSDMDANIPPSLGWFLQAFRHFATPLLEDFLAGEGRLLILNLDQYAVDPRGGMWSVNH